MPEEGLVLWIVPDSNCPNYTLLTCCFYNWFLGVGALYCNCWTNSWWWELEKMKTRLWNVVLLKKKLLSVLCSKAGSIFIPEILATQFCYPSHLFFKISNNMLTCCYLWRKVLIFLFQKHMDTMELSTVGKILEYLQNGISVECRTLDSIKPTFKMLFQNTQLIEKTMQEYHRILKICAYRMSEFIIYHLEILDNFRTGKNVF